MSLNQEHQSINDQSGCSDLSKSEGTEQDVMKQLARIDDSWCQSTNESIDELEEPEVRFAKLIQDGKRVPATSPNVDINKRPPYLDEEIFRKAQKSVNMLYSNLSMASTTGLIILLQVDSILQPLLRTGKSRTVSDLHDRYVGTAKCIKAFYESNFYEPNSEGWRYINLVRAMHQHIHKIMNEKRGGTTTTNGLSDFEPHELWVNQYDMALTQFAFVGMYFVEPEQCGAFDSFKNDKLHMKRVAYYWRLISYYFGIEERFNIFVYHDDMDKQLAYMRLLFNHIKLELLGDHRIDVGVHMGEGFLLAFEDLATELTFNVLDHHWWNSISISGSEKPRPYSLSERWKASWLKLYFRLIFRSKIMLSIINWVYKRKFEKFSNSAHIIKPKLEKKYGHLIYE